jgi:hypothetical protein
VIASVFQYVTGDSTAQHSTAQHSTAQVAEIWVVTQRGSRPMYGVQSRGKDTPGISGSAEGLAVQTANINATRQIFSSKFRRQKLEELQQI